MFRGNAVPAGGVALHVLLSTGLALISRWPSGAVGVASVVLGFEALEGVTGLIQMKHGGGTVVGPVLRAFGNCFKDPANVAASPAPYGHDVSGSSLLGRWLLDDLRRAARVGRVACCPQCVRWP